MGRFSDRIARALRTVIADFGDNTLITYVYPDCQQNLSLGQNFLAETFNV